MYATIRHATVTSVDQMIQRVNQELIPNIVTKHPGFIALYFVKVSENELMTMTLFDTKEHSEESNRIVLDWIRQNVTDLEMQGPDVMMGDVKIIQIARPEEFPGQKAA